MRKKSKQKNRKRNSRGPTKEEMKKAADDYKDRYYDEMTDEKAYRLSKHDEKAIIEAQREAIRNNPFLRLSESVIRKGMPEKKDIVVSNNTRKLANKKVKKKISPSGIEHEATADEVADYLKRVLESLNFLEEDRRFQINNVESQDVGSVNLSRLNNPARLRSHESMGEILTKLAKMKGTRKKRRNKKIKKKKKSRSKNRKNDGR